MIKDINDQAWRADLLGKMLTANGRHWVHVNPIPLNPTPGSIWTASTRATERAFVDALAAHGIPVTVRDTRGQDIDGACGQLAAADIDQTAKITPDPESTTADQLAQSILDTRRKLSRPTRRALISTSPSASTSLVRVASASDSGTSSNTTSVNLIRP